MPLSLHAAMALAGSASVRTDDARGGETRLGELAMVGPLALASIATLRFDTVVLGCCGISADGHVMAHDLGDAAVKQALFAAGGRRILVADGAKCGRSALAVVGRLSAFDILVTDSSTPLSDRWRSSRPPRWRFGVSSRAQVTAHRARPAASRSPRIAVTAVFVAHGLLFASWTAHIPHVMRHLGLSDGTLGIALLGAPVGSVAAMVLASYLIPKLGSRRVV